MEVQLLLTAILALLIFATTIYHFIKKIRFERFIQVDITIIFIGIIYLLFSTILFLWTFKILPFNTTDLFIVYAIILATQMISLITILYAYQQNKKILYTLYLLIILLPLTILSPSYLHLIIPFSLFVILLSFIIFSDSHQASTMLLILYASISILGYLLTLAWPTLTTTLTLLSTFLFLLFTKSFLKQLRGNKKPFITTTEKQNEHIIIHFLKHFVFIIIITNLIFIGTIGIHEIGHLTASQLIEGCEGNKIIYETSSLPHTEVNCKDTTAQQTWILTGILLPILIAGLLFFGGGHAMKELALQITGISLVISYLDLQALGLSKTIALFTLLIGGFLFILSLILLAKTRTQQ